MRKKYIKVENISLPRLSHAEFINFMERFLALLPLEAEEAAEEGDPMGAPKVGITAEQVTEAKTYLSEMNDLNRETKVKAETKSKAEIDRQRDALWTAIIQRILTSRNVPIPTESAAAEKLYIVVKPYTGMNRLPNNQQTETVKGLLTDLNKPEIQEAITTLGLENYIDELSACNQQYEALVKGADVARAAASLGNKNDFLRQQLTDLYREMADFAFATNLLHETEESIYFLSGLNGLIHDVETAYNLRDKAKHTSTTTPEKPEDGNKGDGGLEFVPVE